MELVELEVVVDEEVEEEEDVEDVEEAEEEEAVAVVVVVVVMELLDVEDAEEATRVEAAAEEKAEITDGWEAVVCDDKETLGVE